MTDLKRDNIEVRLNRDGSVDEIVICDPHDGRCLFHLEQMDDHYYWMRAYGITQDMVAHIGAGIGKIRGRPILGEDVQPGKVYPEGVMYGGKDNPSKEIKGWEVLEGALVWSNYAWEDAHHENEHTLEKYRTPEETRYAKVLELLDRFGVDALLNDIITVYVKGRRAPHDLALIKEVQQARVKYAEANKAAWDKHMEEWIQKSKETDGEVHP